MRFFALLAAFAAVLINHTGEASEVYTDAVSALNTSIFEIVESLVDYSLKRKLNESEDLSALNSTESLRDELAGDFEKAERERKDVDKCRETLKNGTEPAQRQHRDRIELCLSKNGHTSQVEPEITRLQKAGKAFKRKILQLSVGPGGDLSRPELPIRPFIYIRTLFEEWKLQVEELINGKNPAHEEDAIIYSECRNPSLVEVDRYLSSLKTFVKECIVASPWRKPDSTPVANQEFITEPTLSASSEHVTENEMKLTEMIPETTTRIAMIDETTTESQVDIEPENLTEVSESATSLSAENVSAIKLQPSVAPELSTEVLSENVTEAELEVSIAPEYLTQV